RNAADVAEALEYAPTRAVVTHATPPRQARLAEPVAHPALDLATMPATTSPIQLESRILLQLTPSPTEENDLIRDLGLAASTVSAALLSLELQGRITRLAGGRLALS
ncbi:MAG: DNA-protecting protein DprA, partial [Paracoccus sp. (in: a-proteobacteria)]|nr:DNA-protecting protein DprA [Paracoccus sp. (in: a-proteobacteria)]